MESLVSFVPSGAMYYYGHLYGNVFKNRIIYTFRSFYTKRRKRFSTSQFTTTSFRNLARGFLLLKNAGNSLYTSRINHVASSTGYAFGPPSVQKAREAKYLRLFSCNLCQLSTPSRLHVAFSLYFGPFSLLRIF